MISKQNRKLYFNHVTQFTILNVSTSLSCEIIDNQQMYHLYMIIFFNTRQNKYIYIWLRDIIFHDKVRSFYSYRHIVLEKKGNTNICICFKILFFVQNARNLKKKSPLALKQQQTQIQHMFFPGASLILASKIKINVRSCQLCRHTEGNSQLQPEQRSL